LIKRSGAPRLIESPKWRLKQMQRQILTHILVRVPPHRAAHGFVRGRSIWTFAAPHAGQRFVMRIDLADFFPSFSGARVQAFFRTAGYPESVADLLGGICTNAAPAPTFEACQPYGFPHLPQARRHRRGWRMLVSIVWIAGWRDSLRQRGRDITRYADDLAFSGGEAFDRRVERFATHVAVLLEEEGFAVNYRKTRIMRQGVRQRLAGLVTNRHPNVARPDFDRLKATLTNCARHGPFSENREGVADFRAHLQGRVAFVESVNAAKGAKLRAVFERIEWEAESK
jgi:hypothetical protein